MIPQLGGTGQPSEVDFVIFHLCYGWEGGGENKYPLKKGGDISQPETTREQHRGI